MTANNSNQQDRRWQEWTSIEEVYAALSEESVLGSVEAGNHFVKLLDSVKNSDVYNYLDENLGWLFVVRFPVSDNLYKKVTGRRRPLSSPKHIVICCCEDNSWMIEQFNDRVEFNEYYSGSFRKDKDGNSILVMNDDGREQIFVKGFVPPTTSDDEATDFCNVCGTTISDDDNDLCQECREA